MGRVIAYRGPDGEGIWTDANVGFVHRRLAIIDLSAAANQPMCNEDGTVWITFNGEVYNFQELRRDLQGRGHCFRTQSDTEAIIHAYEEYGRGCVGKLRGMFAFAIWDGRTRTLFAARDRVGKKPFFYYLGKDRFAFASEIKALLIDETVPRQPDLIAIDHFLALGYVPGPRTAFQGIKKLPAAHWMELCGGKLEYGRYWKLQYTSKRKIAYADAVVELRARLAEAVRLRLVSDVPLGAFLSGGVDSSAVVIEMARAMDRPVKTFSIGFGDSNFDERRFAREVARRYATDHTELVIDAPVADILSTLAWHYDEPLGDCSSVPSFAVAQLTRQHVTVALNGDGADEAFGGYDRYKMDRLVNLGGIIPENLRRQFWKAMQSLPPGARELPAVKKIVRLAEVMAMPSPRRYAQWVEHFGPDDRRRLYTRMFSEAVSPGEPDNLFASIFRDIEADHWLDVILGADINLYLADDLLVKMDRATMANSLEARSPFLDHEFLEFAASLPPNFKQAWGTKKRVLKNMLRGSVSDELLD
jgi:asparagine synthase (glutamine-hydrolysing)